MGQHVSDSEFVVAADAAGTRLDKFLADPSRLGSRAKAAAALERGKVFLNGREAALANAPESKDGCIVVPRIVEG